MNNKPGSLTNKPLFQFPQPYNIPSILKKNVFSSPQAILI